jgi:hypothetical protein
VFLSLFLFLNLEILNSTIKTDNVIVDTTNLIDSSSKMMNTHKTMLIPLDNQHIFSKAPENTFLRKFYNKKEGIFLLEQLPKNHSIFLCEY